MTSKYLECFEKDEKEEVWKGIVKFVNKNTVRRTWSSGGDYNFLCCPCCDYSCMLSDWRDYPIWNSFFVHFMKHLEGQIRLNASKKHIDILKELFGKEFCIKLLERYAAKNVIMAIVLKNEIRRMKKGGKNKNG